MAKNFTEILGEMIQNDADNNTATMARCDDFVRGDLVKAGAHITMGVPREVYMDMVNNKRVPILLMIDIKEYERIQKG